MTVFIKDSLAKGLRVYGFLKGSFNHLEIVE